MSWAVANPYKTALYREQTAASPAFSLNRKRCACSKVVTAKQLRQYGACSTCVRAAAADDVKEAA